MAPSAVESLVTTLKKRKGVGPDGVSTEILQTDGGAVAVKLTEIHERVILGADWLSNGQVGRIHNIYKHKGNAAECDNSRGILLHCCGAARCVMTWTKELTMTRATFYVHEVQRQTSRSDSEHYTPVTNTCSRNKLTSVSQTRD